MSGYAFGRMLSRRPPELKMLWAVLLDNYFSKPKGQVWVSRQRMGEYKIGQIMKDMAVKSGLTAANENYQPFEQKNMFTKAKECRCLQRQNH